MLTSDAALPAAVAGKVPSYESFIAGQAEEFDWPELDERTASSLCYTSGTTGNPKGVLYSHRSTVLHAYAGCMADTMGLSARDTVLADRADVPCERLGPAVQRADDRREARVPRSDAWAMPRCSRN